MAGTKCCYQGKIAGLYDLEGTLGKGHFAVVKLARHVFTGEKVAVKVIDKSKLDQAAAGHLLQEVLCMKLVQHPNVVRLYEVIDTQTKLYLILELGDGGDMFDHIMKYDGGLSEPQAKRYFAQIVHAISYCHKLHVVHRDLKPENVVFFKEQGVVKLTDFGFSNRFQPGTMLTTSCGSLAYSAPEILLGDEYDAPAVDIWSLGVILYMLVCGHPPFQEVNDSETLTMIMDCRYKIPHHMSQQCADLISRMLQRAPNQRASLEEIEAHPWLQGVDPSPASRLPLPLTSYKSVSEEEHEVIIQAMICGNIADRSAIQEALEYDLYNHITATYFLLAERILREKQNQPLNIVYSWATPDQNRRPLSQPVGTVCNSEIHPAFADMADGFSAFSTHRSSSETFAEDPGVNTSCKRKFISLPLVGEEEVLPYIMDRKQTVRMLLQPSLLDAPIARSLPALQQIYEEEEDEEDDCANDSAEKGLLSKEEPNLSFQKSLLFETSLHQHDTQGQALKRSSHTNKEKGLLDRLMETGISLNSGDLTGQEHACDVPKEAKQKIMNKSMVAANTSNDLSIGLNVELIGHTELCCMKEKHCSARTENDQLTWPNVDKKEFLESENNNNTTKLEGIIIGQHPENMHLLHHLSNEPLVIDSNDCPIIQGTENMKPNVTGVTSVLKENSKLSKGASERGGYNQPKYSADKISESSDNATLGIESTADPVIKLDPAKNKSSKLKDRIMQFPLCEKALAFRIKPSSKESLLSLGQFNCCHVI
ncbi:SNF-related serine/threonine-protein kinase-like [Pleurodeles waltl]|uniref:SNF-related serine/threonine-protein kinase-like n=1 Tax=Pleurodeles waltl TaxID=8319 RepID=UPI0037094C62